MKYLGIKQIPNNIIFKKMTKGAKEQRQCYNSVLPTELIM